MNHKECGLNMDELVRKIYSTRKNPGLNEKRIQDFQINAHLSLPPTFIEFLRRMNGGEIYQNMEVFGLSDGNESSQDQKNEDLSKKFSSTKPLGLLPFANAGITYAFDINKPQPDGEYPIVMYNEELNILKPTNYTRFDTWLNDVINRDS